MTTYCDVNTCEDCPRYGDDCDGDKRVEHTDLISRADAIEAVASITMSIHLSDVICDKLLELPSAELVLQTPQTYGNGINTSNAEVFADYISRLDAIRALAEHFSFDDGCSNIYKDIDYYKGIAEHILKNVPSALPSADADRPKVIGVDYSPYRIQTTAPSADAVPQSEQYKKGFEDAKRAFLVEYARESENMRKRNAQLEVMLNAYRETARPQGEWVGLYECSICGNQAFDFIEGCVDGVEYLPNYCPNCGARMKEGAE